MDPATYLLVLSIATILLSRRSVVPLLPNSRHSLLLSRWISLMLSVVFIAITHPLLYLATLSVLTCCACLYFCALFHYLFSLFGYRPVVLLSPQLAILSSRIAVLTVALLQL